MPDPVFKVNQTFGGALRADQVVLKLNKRPVTGMLLQNIQFNYTQQVTLLYEIGGEKNKAQVYYVGGRCQGTMTVGRVIGPSSSATFLLTAYGDICDPKPIEFDAKAGCLPGGAAGTAGVTYTMDKAVLTSVGGSVAAQDCVIHEQLQFMFINMTVG